MSQANYLRIPHLKEQFGVSRATLYRWIQEYGFPRPIKLGPGTAAWRRSEVEEWVNQRPRG